MVSIEHDPAHSPLLYAYLIIMCEYYPQFAYNTRCAYEYGSSMEKVIYALWRAPDIAPERLARDLLEKTGPEMARIGGVHSVRINLTDSDVDSAAGLKRCTTQPPIDEVVQVWLDVSHGEFRASVDALI